VLAYHAVHEIGPLRGDAPKFGCCSQLQFTPLRYFKLGKRPGCRIGYRTFGTLNSEKSTGVRATSSANGRDNERL
jgi:hypothetical protein